MERDNVHKRQAYLNILVSEITCYVSSET